MKTINQTADWGYYVVQIDEGAAMLSLSAEFGFTKPPGMVQIPCELDKAISLSRASGNGCITGWGAPTNASICATIWDSAGRALVNFKGQALDRSTQNIPVNVLQKADALITGLTLSFFVDEPGAQTFSWGLVLS